MKGRHFLTGFLVLLVIVGLTAGIFADSIQRALTLPMMNSMMAKGIVKAAPSAVSTKPQGTAQAMMPTQGPVNVLGQDTFKRGDQPLWGTASDGRQWDGDANALNAIFGVSNQTGHIMHGNGTFNALLGPSATNMEAMLTGSINHFNGTVNLGVVVRYSDVNHWYKALLDGRHLTLLLRANQKTTTLGNIAFPAQDGVRYSLRLRAIGAMLFVRAWPSTAQEPADWQITATDMTLTRGQAGVRVVSQNTTVIEINTFIAMTASSLM